MSPRLGGKTTKQNLLKMYPNRLARWRSVEKDTLKKMAEKENKGAIRYKLEVRDKFIKQAKIVVYSKKKLGKFESKVANFLNAPSESRIWLDEYGAFIWRKLDGYSSVKDIGVEVIKEFGEDENVYHRLGKFLFDLERSGLIEIHNSPKKGAKKK